MNNLNRIINHILKKGFPELSNAIIFVGHRRLKDAFFEYVTKSKGSYSINIDLSLKKANRNIIIGGLAHELSHILLEHKRNSMINQIDMLLYTLSSRYETWDERRTDLLTIKRGFGKELLAFLRYAERKREKYDEDDGLTAEEIRGILKSEKIRKKKRIKRQP
jgi:hypothetical protein